MPKEYAYTISAFTRNDEGDKRQYVTVSTVASSEEDALSQAKALVTRDQYELESVTELTDRRPSRVGY